MSDQISPPPINPDDLPQVPMNPTPVGQAFTIDHGTAPDGTPVALVCFSIPRATVMMEFTEQAAKDFCQTLYRQFSGIVPATAADMPHQNGHKPGGLRPV
jgi:hypothetical protein